MRMRCTSGPPSSCLYYTSPNGASPYVAFHILWHLRLIDVSCQIHRPPATLAAANFQTGDLGPSGWYYEMSRLTPLRASRQVTSNNGSHNWGGAALPLNPGRFLGHHARYSIVGNAMGHPGLLVLTSRSSWKPLGETPGVNGRVHSTLDCSARIALPFLNRQHRLSVNIKLTISRRSDRRLQTQPLQHKGIMHPSLCPMTKTATPVFIRVAWYSTGALDMSPLFQ
jgi:hypothetical protein